MMRTIRPKGGRPVSRRWASSRAANRGKSCLLADWMVGSSGRKGWRRTGPGEFAGEFFLDALGAQAEERKFLGTRRALVGQGEDGEAIVAVHLAGVNAFGVGAAVRVGGGGTMVGHRRVAELAMNRVLAVIAI